MNKKVVRKADFISYVTNSKLQNDYPAAPNAITVSLSNVLIKDILCSESLEPHRFTQSIFKIGLIGGFDAKYKGQDILLKAINTLPQSIKENIRISFIGKGDFSWVLQLAEDLNLQHAIEYIGPLESGKQINDFLQTLALYIQPSLTEGMPRATIEAMARGCPVIGSNVGGIPDIVSPNLVHTKGNVNELSESIKYLYNNRDTLLQESYLSLEKAIPYLKENLDKKRRDFYNKMNEKLNYRTVLSNGDIE